mgnify:CR=1 FL=1
MITLQCSWCNTIMNQVKSKRTYTTHTICKDCYKKEKEEWEKQKKEKLSFDTSKMLRMSEENVYYHW